MGDNIVELNNITKKYNGSEEFALRDVNFCVEKGEFIAIMGPSGSGKSTLLNIIGCMDNMTSGEYYLNGEAVHNTSARHLHKLRKDYIGFVFQHFALMNNYTAYENIELSLLASKVSRKKRKQIIANCTEQLGIKELLSKRPTKMSGGQQQRVAIARALVSGCEIILADEPTGALDQKTGQEVLELLRKINESGKTVILVTHDANIAAKTDRIINIEDGRIVSDSIMNT